MYLKWSKFEEDSKSLKQLKFNKYELIRLMCVKSMLWLKSTFISEFGKEKKRVIDFKMLRKWSKSLKYSIMVSYDIVSFGD